MSWKKWSHLRADADSSHAAATLRRTLDNLQDTVAARTKGAACGWAMDQPLRVGTIIPRPLPLWWPVDPEEAQLTFRVHYEVEHAPVLVRGRFADHDNRREDRRPAWTELAVTSGPETVELTVDISERRRGTRWLPSPLEVWCRDAEETINAADLYFNGSPPATRGYNEAVRWNSIWLEGDLDADFGYAALDCLSLTFYDAKGGSGGGGAEINVDRLRFQSAVFDNTTGTFDPTTLVYCWPRQPYAGIFARIGDALFDAESVDLQRHGTLVLHGIEIVGVEGEPYLEAVDGGVFSLQGTAPRWGIAPAVPVRAMPHRQLYQAEEYLWTRRRAPLAWGPRPRRTRDASNSLLRLDAWHHVTWSSVTTDKWDWQTLAEVQLPPGDKFELDGVVYERQHLDVTLALLPMRNDESAPSLPLEFRTRTLDPEDGSQVFAQTGSEVVVSETIPPSQLNYTWAVYSDITRERAVPASLNNLQGLLDWEEWGKHGLLLLTIPHNDTDGSGHRTLQVQARIKPAIEDEFDTALFRDFGYTLMTLFCCVEERGGAAWEDLGVSSSGSDTTSGDIRLRDRFLALEASGASVIAPVRRLGAGGEISTVVDNDHHLRSALARRVFIAEAWLSDPIESTTFSPSWDDVFERVVTFAAGRNQVELAATLRYADLRVEIYDEAGSTSVDSVTLSESAGTITTVTYSPTIGSLYDHVLIRLRLRRNLGSPGRLYGVTVRERAIPVTLL
jgi:hypothetical protein